MLYLLFCVCARANSLQSCLPLCNPMDWSPPGSSVHGDSLGKNTGVGCPPPGVLPNPGIEIRSPAWVGRFFTTSTTWEAPYGSILNL